MNIYHLKYFIDAARFLSISRSAEHNHISHSAVSQAIKSLETHFDADLIFHAKRKFELTPQGELCLIEGQRVLTLLSEIKENIQSNSSEVRGSLVIWAPQSLIVESLYKALEIYQKKYPKVQINLRPGAASLVRNAITSGQGQVGLLVDDDHVGTLQSLTIQSGHFVLIAKKKDGDIRSAPVIVTSKDKIEVQYLKKSFKEKYKSEMNIGMEIMSWSVIKNLVEKNFGIGYVPEYCVAHELASGRVHRVNPRLSTFEYSVKAVWSEKKHLPPNAKLFIDLLKQR
jgi:DNA-binding transcriptional LysR family regulator